MNVDLTDSRERLRALEDYEMATACVKRPLARRRVAASLKQLPGTLERLANGRLKSVSTALYRALHAAAVRQLERDIDRLQTQLALALERGLHNREVAICEARAALDEARRLLNE